MLFEVMDGKLPIIDAAAGLGLLELALLLPR
jgi:hypothetical protein